MEATQNSSINDTKSSDHNNIKTSNIKQDVNKKHINNEKHNDIFGDLLLNSLLSTPTINKLDKKQLVSQPTTSSLIDGDKLSTTTKSLRDLKITTSPINSSSLEQQIATITENELLKQNLELQLEETQAEVRRLKTQLKVLNDNFRTKLLQLKKRSEYEKRNIELTLSNKIKTLLEENKKLKKRVNDAEANGIGIDALPTNSLNDTLTQNLPNDANNVNNELIKLRQEKSMQEKQRNQLGEQIEKSEAKSKTLQEQNLFQEQKHSSNLQELKYSHENEKQELQDAHNQLLNNFKKRNSTLLRAKLLKYGENLRKKFENEVEVKFSEYKNAIKKCEAERRKLADTLSERNKKLRSSIDDNARLVRKCDSLRFKLDEYRSDSKNKNKSRCKHESESACHVCAVSMPMESTKDLVRPDSNRHSHFLNHNLNPNLNHNINANPNHSLYRVEQKYNNDYFNTHIYLNLKEDDVCETYKVFGVAEAELRFFQSSRLSLFERIWQCAIRFRPSIKDSSTIVECRGKNWNCFDQRRCVKETFGLNVRQQNYQISRTFLLPSSDCLQKFARRWTKQRSIEGLSREYNCRLYTLNSPSLSYNDCEERQPMQLTIVGNERNVMELHRFIIANYKYDQQCLTNQNVTSLQTQVDRTLLIPQQLIGHLVGRNFENLQKIERQCQVRLSLPRRRDESEVKYGIDCEGLEDNSGSGLGSGSGSSKLKAKISSDLIVEVRLQMFGMDPDSLDKAQELLWMEIKRSQSTVFKKKSASKNQKTNKSKNFDNARFVRIVPVSSQCLGLIVGSKRSRLNYIKSTTGCKIIDIPAQPPSNISVPELEVRIEGEPGSVTMAAEIIGAISQHKQTNRTHSRALALSSTEKTLLKSKSFDQLKNSTRCEFQFTNSSSDLLTDTYSSNSTYNTGIIIYAENERIACEAVKKLLIELLDINIPSNLPQRYKNHILSKQFSQKPSIHKPHKYKAKFKSNNNKHRNNNNPSHNPNHNRSIDSYDISSTHLSSDDIIVPGA